MERRRRLAADWDGTIPCRQCQAPVALRRTHIARSADGRMWTTCEACHHSFAVRVNDPALEIARAAAAVAPSVAPVATRRRFGRRFPAR